MKKNMSSNLLPESLSAQELLARLRCKGTLLMASPSEDGRTEWLLFDHPVKILQAFDNEMVKTLFEEIEHALQQGAYVAGVLSYEASQAFDEKYKIISGAEFPLMQLAIFDKPPVTLSLPKFQGPVFSKACQPEVSKAEYCDKFLEIKRQIVAGNIYQANLTFRAYFKENLPPEELFLSLCQSHPVPHAAYVNMGRFKVVSLSPELFFARVGDRIFSRPMKGTAKRLPMAGDDQKQAQWLSQDIKNQAENVMITDMVRNDFGRICLAGSIEVDPLFHVDTYRTVHQMVSTVYGKLKPEVSYYQMMKALFPPASITGAPKMSAVRLIAENEKSPRQIYTGTIGFITPRHSCQFNVAIRTLLFDHKENRIETGMGGGIVYDSQPLDEWHEALLKCQYATYQEPEFEVFETLSWLPLSGFAFLTEHLIRLASSQAYFGRPFKRLALEHALTKWHETLAHSLDYPNGACVKIRVNKEGNFAVEISPPRLPNWSTTSLKVAVSSHPVNSKDVFLYHKTTRRESFRSQLREAQQQGFHEVIFYNENGELTEGSISSLFLKCHDGWVTPALTCGLLPGIWRAHALKKYQAKEVVLTLADLRNAEQIMMGNSLRGEGRVVEVDKLWIAP